MEVDGSTFDGESLGPPGRHPQKARGGWLSGVFMFHRPPKPPSFRAVFDTCISCSGPWACMEEPPHYLCSRKELTNCVQFNLFLMSFFFVSLVFCFDFSFQTNHWF